MVHDVSLQKKGCGSAQIASKLAPLLLHLHYLCNVEGGLYNIIAAYMKRGSV